MSTAKISLVTVAVALIVSVVVAGVINIDYVRNHSDQVPVADTSIPTDTLEDLQRQVKTLGTELVVIKSMIESIPVKETDNTQNLPPDTTAVREEIAMLRAEVAAMASASEHLSYTESESTSPTSADAMESEIAEADRASSQQLRSEIALIEDHMLGQYVDNEWATEVSLQVEQTMQGLGAQDGALELLGLECRTSLCRIDIQYDELAADTDVVSHLIDRVGVLLPNAVVEYQTPIGPSNTVTLYFSRMGYEFPS